MNASQLSTALGVPVGTIGTYVRTGKLAATKVPMPGSAVGYAWDITTPVEEAREILGKRIIRNRKMKTPAGKRAALKPLPANRDLFVAEEAAKYAGVSKSTVYGFIKEQKVQTLQNGRNNYIPRAAVEQLREKYAKPEPIVEPQTALPTLALSVPKTDPKVQDALDRIENNLNVLAGFIKRFAGKVGYEEA